MNFKELAEHYGMTEAKLASRLYNMGLIYKPDKHPYEPTQKAINDWVAEMLGGEYRWHPESIWIIQDDDHIPEWYIKRGLPVPNKKGKD